MAEVNNTVTEMANGSRNFAQLTQFLDRRAHDLTKRDCVGKEEQLVIKEEIPVDTSPNTDFSTLRI
jgi:hypothetical protein